MTNNIQYVNFGTKAKLKDSRFEVILGNTKDTGEPAVLLRYIDPVTDKFITSQVYTRVEFDALFEAQHTFLNGKKFTRNLYNDTFGVIK